MESIPELRRRLANAKLKQQHREGKIEARNLKREIRQIEHPYFHSLNVGIKETGRNVGKNVKLIGKTAYKVSKERAEAINHSHGSNQGHSNFARYYKSRPSKTKIKQFKKTKRHRKYYGSKYKPKRKVHSNGSGYNYGGNLNLFGLDF